MVRWASSPDGRGSVVKAEQMADDDDLDMCECLRRRSSMDLLRPRHVWPA